jgi:hypothetical protein
MELRGIPASWTVLNQRVRCSAGRALTGQRRAFGAAGLAGDYRIGVYGNTRVASRHPIRFVRFKWRWEFQLVWE